MRILTYAVLLMMLSQPAWALTTGELFKNCKPWANNGYSGSGLTETQANGAFQCIGFQAELYTLGNMRVCMVILQLD